MREYIEFLDKNEAKRHAKKVKGKVKQFNGSERIFGASVPYTTWRVY